MPAFIPPADASPATTFPRLLAAHAAARPHAPALREKKYGIWQTLDWAALAELARQIAAGLHAAGLKRGEHLAVVGENRPRLYATMLAAQAIGAVPMPLYQDAVAAEFVHPLTHAGVAMLVVEDQEQVDKALEVRTLLPDDGGGIATRIWYDDPRGLRHYDAPGVEALDTLLAAGTAHLAAHPGWYDAEVAAGAPDDVAAMFTTSGTTGRPKGVVHTHRTLIDRARAGAAFDRLTADEDVLAYLPPAWIGQNIFSYAQWLACGYVVNCPESPATVAIDLNDIGPTYYFAPPRIFEALLTAVTIRMEDAGRIKGAMYRHFMALAARVGPRRMDRQPVGLVDRLHYALGQALVYGPLRNALGLSRVRVAYTAGEAIGPELFVFYRSIGVNLKQLYGSTETAVFVCLQPDHEARADTVGVPIDGVELRVDDGGEILVRSPGLLKEYHRDPDATAEVMTADGWFRTGDAGFVDAAGHLRIIDRAKDVGRLADGSLFAPKYVENKLKFFPQIKEAVAIDGGRGAVCALVNIDFDAVGHWAERRNLPYAGYTDLATQAEVRDLIRDCVEKVNADLATDERLAGSQIARFLVLHKELDPDDGELTRTKKVRRGFIAERYAVLVDALYAGATRCHVETPVKFEDGRSGVVAADLELVDARTFPPARAAA